MSAQPNANAVSTQFIESLIKGTCHDIGAPARHLVQFSSMLEASLTDAQLSEKQLRWLSFLNESGKQIQSMLGSLNTITQLSMASSQREQLSLKQVFDRVLDYHLTHTVDEKRKVLTSLSGNWPSLIAAKMHWKILFSSLLENACQFHEANHASDIQIAASCNYANSVLTFELEDNGIGVRESQLNDLTRAFKRMNGKEEYTGLGMGLTYCYFIAEINNASLDFSISSLGGLKVSYQQSIGQDDIQTEPNA